MMGIRLERFACRGWRQGHGYRRSARGKADVITNVSPALCLSSSMMVLLGDSDKTSQYGAPQYTLPEAGIW